MIRWRLIEKVWCNWPSRPDALFEFIGGSYLATSPHLSYKTLFDGLSNNNIAIHAWSYIPGFDHQAQANSAWINLRHCRKKLEDRIGNIPRTTRIGHSLGVKLHLLAPDSGRNCNGLISLSFNNFAAYKSIPILKDIAPKLGIKPEFLPSPNETIDLIYQRYHQPKNLIISFKSDNLDESSSLLKILQKRRIDDSRILILEGDHLSPTGISMYKRINKSINRVNELKGLIDAICNWK